MTIIDDYLATLKASERTALEKIRKLIHATVPGAEEVKTYGMPGFKYKGKYLISFAAFKDHLSIFPGAAPVEALKDQLVDFKTSKGTVQFTLEHPIPDALITQMVAMRASAIEAGNKGS